MRLFNLSRPLYIIFCIGLVSCLSTTAAYSQGIGGILIAPARLEATIDEEGSVPSIHVINNSNKGVRVETAYGWGTHDLYGQPQYLSPEYSQVLLDLNPGVFTINPGEIGEVKIKVSKSDLPLYPVIFFNLMSLDDLAGNVVQIAVPLLLTSSGQLTGEGVVELYWLEKKGAGIELNLIISNPNEAHIRSCGKIRLVHEFTQRSIELDMPEHLILPGAERLIKKEWQPKERIEPGVYSLELAGLSVRQGVNVPKFMVDAWQNIHIYNTVAERMTGAENESTMASQ